MTYAVERKLLRDQLEQVRQREQQERELSRWDGYSHADPAAVTASLFGIRPLWDQSPQVFEELLAEYSTLLDLAVERRMFQTEQDHAEKTRALADSLGRAKAGPRDVVELHSRAIRKKSKVPQHKKAQVYIEEGRLKIVELMGYLVSYYRNYALGRRFGESSGPSVSNPKSENATEDSP